MVVLRGETIGDFMLVIALLWALMYMVCALIGWANADDSDQFIAWVFLVFYNACFYNHSSC